MTDAATRAQALLHDHRNAIDRLDAILVYTLAERFKQTQSVGRLKAEHNLPPSDPAREANQMARLEQVQEIQNREVPAGMDMAQWALAWCLREKVVTCVIPGCKDPAQVERNALAADILWPPV